MPTTSAPAARASSAFAPGGQNTATRTDLPVPAGSTVEPRTCWSDFLASTPRRTATSTDSTNLAFWVFLTIFSASSIEYALPGATAAKMAFCRFVCAMVLTLHRQAHAAGRSRDRTHRSVQVGRRQIGFFRLGDVLELLAGDLAHLFGVWALGAGLDAHRLLQQDGRRGRLGDEGEGTVRIGGNDDRNRQTRFQLLRGGIERLAEFHDVQAALTQRGTDRRRGVGLTSLHLQLDVTDNFLCHLSTLRVLAPEHQAPHRTGKITRPGIAFSERTNGHPKAAMVPARRRLEGAAQYSSVLRGRLN